MPRVCGCIAPFGDFTVVDASQAHPDRYNNPEWVPPEVVVVWGNEPLASNADGYVGHWLVQCVQMGTKIISIDPRLTWWGARAEYWLQIRPGTDAALACAWLHTIIYEDLYDKEYVDMWCAGFDELKESVKDTTPEWAAEICELSAVNADDCVAAIGFPDFTHLSFNGVVCLVPRNTFPLIFAALPCALHGVFHTVGMVNRLVKC